MANEMQSVGPLTFVKKKKNNYILFLYKSIYDRNFT